MSYDCDDDDIHADLNDEEREALEQKLENSNVWITVAAGKYTTAHGVSSSLPPGIYEIQIDMGQPVLCRIDENTEELSKFSDPAHGKIMSDIERFWTSREKFKKHGIAYKRGILLYGPPGTGKSSLVRLVIDDVVVRGGVAIKFRDVGSYISGMQMLRQIAPTMPVVVVMEDIESVMRYDESTTLNVLDGMYGIDNVVYLATTNHVEQLQERIKNRPSRFDKRLFIGCPEEPVRREYLQKLDKTGTFNDLSVLDTWIADSAGFSFGHLKELYVSTVLFENDYVDVLRDLKEMYKPPVNESLEIENDD